MSWAKGQFVLLLVLAVTAEGFPVWNHIACCIIINVVGVSSFDVDYEAEERYRHGERRRVRGTTSAGMEDTHAT